VALGRRQVADADLLGAVGTLERVLLAHPEANEARLLYASLLCRLDDTEGAGVELGLLPPEAITEEEWQEVTKACGPLPRPGPASTTAEGGARP
jgi:thioredoxin-like negative regulator of GroEL